MFATPQSITSTAPTSPTITFSGFRSRCPTPFARRTATRPRSADLPRHRVLRLEVAMRDAVCVRERGRLADACEDAQTLRACVLLACPRVQTHAAHELHRVVEAPVVKRAGVVHRHDSGMLQRRDHTRLA